MITKKAAKIIVSWLSAVALTACGGWGNWWGDKPQPQPEKWPSSKIKAVDGPIAGASVSIKLQDGNEIEIWQTDENGTTILKLKTLKDLDLNPDENVTIVTHWWEDENWPVDGELALPVMTVAQLTNYVENNATLHVNPSSTFFNYVQTQTNYNLWTLLPRYVKDKNGDWKVDLKDVPLTAYPAYKDLVQRDPDGDGVTLEEAIRNWDKAELASDVEAIFQTPQISLDANTTTIELWDDVELSVEIKNPVEWHDYDIIWYDYNGDEIPRWEKVINIEPNQLWELTYSVKVIDTYNNKEAEANVTIKVNEQAPVLDHIDVTAGSHIGAIDDLGNNTYKAWVDDDEVQWVVTITFSWSEWDESKSVSWYRNSDDVVVESEKYPWQKVTIKWWDLADR